jgi:ElaB/YqjD/DUF883 family membrane-anchored ribosome-binding protein
MSQTNEQPDEPRRSEGDSGGGPGEPAAERRPSSLRDALRGLTRAASEVAASGAEEARRLAETARPEVERRAREATRQAKAAAEAARPHAERAIHDATEYVKTHQDDIRRASKQGARTAASTAARAVTPGPLRPAVDAMSRELRQPSVQTLREQARDASTSKTPGDDEPPGDDLVTEAPPHS